MNFIWKKDCVAYKMNELGLIHPSTVKFPVNVVTPLANALVPERHPLDAPSVRAFPIPGEADLPYIPVETDHEPLSVGRSGKLLAASARVVPELIDVSSNLHNASVLESTACLGICHPHMIPVLVGTHVPPKFTSCGLALGGYAYPASGELFVTPVNTSFSLPR